MATEDRDFVSFIRRLNQLRATGRGGTLREAVRGFAEARKGEALEREKVAIGARSQASLEKAREEQLRVQREGLETAAGAAKVKGITSLLTAPITAGAALETIRPGTVSGLTSAVKGAIGLGGTAAAGVPGLAGAGGLGLLGTQAATTAGAATGIAGAAELGGLGLLAPETATLAGTAGIGGLGLAPVIPEAAAATTAGATAGVTGGLGLSALGVPAAVGLIGSEIGERIFGGEDGLIGSGETTQKVGGIAASTLAGAAVGSLVPIPGVSTAIGAGVGFIVGVGKSIIDDVSILCSEMERQGFVSKRDLIRAEKYKRDIADNFTYIGYLTWAKYLVKAMRKSRVASWAIGNVWKHWCREMGHRVDPNIESNLLGKVLLDTATPVSRIIGRIKCQVSSSQSAEQI